MSTTVEVSEPAVITEPTPAVPLHLRIRRLSNWLTTLVFVAAIAVPLYGTFFRDPPPLDENRPYHKPPPLALKKQVLQDYPKWFDLYFGDRVGYRDVLLGWHHGIVYHVFGEPVSDRGWVGQDGWFFFNVDPYSAPDNRLGKDGDFSTAEGRIRAWADVLADRHAYLKARGIEYVVFVPPDKSNVYPEHLPGYYRRHPPPAAGTRLAELLAERGVRCVDPLPELLAEKERNPRLLYSRKDSHWTPDGARVAYRQLFDELARTRPGLTPHPDSGFELLEGEREADLGRLVGAPPEERQDHLGLHKAVGRTAVEDRAPAFAAVVSAEAKNPALPPRLFTCDAAPGPPLALLHDSFAAHLLPYFSADFRSVAAIASRDLEWPALEVVRPAVVVQELVARRLYMEAPANPPGVKGARR